jgi:hypothetical protein
MYLMKLDKNRYLKKLMKLRKKLNQKRKVVENQIKVIAQKRIRNIWLIKIIFKTIKLKIDNNLKKGLDLLRKWKWMRLIRFINM